MVSRLKPMCRGSRRDRSPVRTPRSPRSRPAANSAGTTAKVPRCGSRSGWARAKTSACTRSRPPATSAAAAPATASPGRRAPRRPAPRSPRPRRTPRAWRRSPSSARRRRLAAHDARARPTDRPSARARSTTADARRAAPTRAGRGRRNRSRAATSPGPSRWLMRRARRTTRRTGPQSRARSSVRPGPDRPWCPSIEGPDRGEDDGRREAREIDPRRSRRGPSGPACVAPGTAGTSRSTGQG